MRAGSLAGMYPDSSRQQCFAAARIRQSFRSLLCRCCRLQSLEHARLNRKISLDPCASYRRFNTPLARTFAVNGVLCYCCIYCCVYPLMSL